MGRQMWFNTYMSKSTNQEEQQMLTTDTTTSTKDMTEERKIDGRIVKVIKDEYMNTLVSTHFSTGTKIHAAYPTSSVALCGGWMKFGALAYRQYSQPTCKRCLKALAEKESK